MPSFEDKIKTMLKT